MMPNEERPSAAGSTGGLELPFWARIAVFALWPAIFTLERLPFSRLRPGEVAVVGLVGVCAVTPIVGFTVHLKTQRRWYWRVAVASAVTMLAAMIFAAYHWGRPK